jgi:C-terminal processing protease CtpA/Prc
MFVSAFKSSTRFALAMTLTGLTGCASDGGLGEAVVVGAMLLPLPSGVDSSVVTAAAGVAAATYVASSVAGASSPTAAPVPAALTTPAAQPPVNLQKLVSREVPDRYRPKSCDYIEMALSEVPMYQASAEPILKQAGSARQVAATQVWQEKGCQPSSLPRGKVGMGIETIDPQRAMALSAPPAGVVVLAIVPGGGAQQAGMLMQDVVVAVDNQPIADSVDFRVAVAKASIGTKVDLKVWRASAFRTVAVAVSAGAAQTPVKP